MEIGKITVEIVDGRLLVSQEFPEPVTPEPEPEPEPKPEIPELERWESNMLSYGKLHGDRFLDGSYTSGYAYYDAQWVFQQTAEYTGDVTWLEYANFVRDLSLTEYVEKNDYKVAGWMNLTRGLTEDFLTTGNMRSREAVIGMSENAMYAADYTPVEWTENVKLSREVAYAVRSYINAELCGEPRRARLTDLYSQITGEGGHLDQWFVGNSDPNFAPFMFGLTAETLIYYWDHVDQDPAILEKIKLGADTTWGRAWLPDSESFFYRAGGDPTPAPDLNLLIAPLFGWLYKQTGEVKYRERGDMIFAGGVKGAWLDGSKQFNQNYRWSFDYLKWRGK